MPSTSRSRTPAFAGSRAAARSSTWACAPLMVDRSRKPFLSAVLPRMDAASCPPDEGSECSRDGAHRAWARTPACIWFARTAGVAGRGPCGDARDRDRARATFAAGRVRGLWRALLVGGISPGGTERGSRGRGAGNGGCDLAGRAHLRLLERAGRVRAGGARGGRDRGARGAGAGGRVRAARRGGGSGPAGSAAAGRGHSAGLAAHT